MADATITDPSVQSEQTNKTRAGQKKASKVNGVPLKPAEGEIPPAAPPLVAVAPKKRGRKPKQMAAVADSLPPQKDATAGDNSGAADQPAGDTVSGTGAPPLVAVAPKKRGQKPKQMVVVADNPPVSGTDATTKTPGPMRDPLPLREGRNTHPGRRDGIQPPPRRSSQEVAAERSRKRLELEEMLRIAEEAKHMLVQMELEDERFVEGIEEECRQPHDHQQQRKALTIVESDDEEIQGIDEVDETEDDTNKDNDDDEDEDEGAGKPKVKAKRRKGVKALKTELRKEINTKVATLRGARGQNNAKTNGGTVRFSPTDLNRTQFAEARVANTKTTPGNVIDEVTIGGLDDTDIEVERPAAFGPVHSQPQAPTIPPGGPGLQLQRNHNRRNNLAGLASRAIAEVLGGKDDTDTNHGPNIAQTKLKIRATVRSQGAGNPCGNPSMGVVHAFGPEHFILQRTWAKVFLPSLMYQFFISKGPFQDFTNNSPAFIALVQEAFNTTHPNVSYTVAAGDVIVTTSFERLKSKRSLIASEALKHVKKYFEGDRFKDRPEDVKNHVWWALRPDGLAYQAFPTPIDCPFDRKSPQYIPPEGRYQSNFIVLVIKKYITLAEGSAILPQIGAENPPIGLYIVVLVAVERVFKTFVKGTYKDPPQFSNENTWRSINDFRESLLRLDAERWDRVLGALRPSSVLGADLDAGLSTLSAYRGDLHSLSPGGQAPSDPHSSRSHQTSRTELAQCDVILKRCIPGFELENLEEILVREGVEVEANVPPISASFRSTPVCGSSPPKGYPYVPPGPHMIPPGYPPMPPYYPAPPYPPPHMQPHPGYNPHLHPMFQHPPQPIPPQHLPPAQSVPHPMSSNGPIPDIKGGDPGFHDMSNPRALARSFGVAPDIVQDLKLGPQPLDKEDIAVGSHGLISGRDSIVAELAFPHDANKWVLVPMRRDSVASSPSTPGPTHTFSAFLPKDHDMVQHIVHIYFECLNFHRPVFLRHEFKVTLSQLYAGESQRHDPGFLCSVYLIFALGTLSELNHRAYGLDREAKNKATSGGTPSLANVNVKTLMPPDWPDHEDFFQRALSIKPELRVTICSLQELILLHCVNVAHFGALLEARAAQVQPDLSRHFLLSHPIAEIQADIFDSLYSPHGQSGDAIMRHATRIVKSMVEFRRHLPEKCKRYFGGTADWSLEEKAKLVQGITEDEGPRLPVKAQGTPGWRLFMVFRGKKPPKQIRRWSDTGGDISGSWEIRTLDQWMNR
ncbi:hypothetical protein EDB86DRAFT_3248061 [Lactarius hatsudake]|nr:hypothetical protein EDB86DRAFT_3248061 [Lactarius hatsudake]